MDRDLSSNLIMESIGGKYYAFHFIVLSSYIMESLQRLFAKSFIAKIVRSHYRGL